MDTGRDYGGYLEWETYGGRCYYPEALAFDSERSALEYFCCVMHVHKIYIPYYLCNAFDRGISRRHLSVERYNIGSDFRSLFEKEVHEGELFALVNYLGQLTEVKIQELQERYQHILVDNTQAFFISRIKYSCYIFLPKIFWGSGWKLSVYGAA